MPFVRPAHAVQIGEFLLDPGLNELRRGDAAQRLPARLADLLLRLAAEPQRAVRRETLLDEVWERRLVNDEVLSRAIADLRLALGDDARAPRYIETLPKIGYRLVAPVSAANPGEVAPQGTPGPEPEPAAPAPGPARSTGMLQRRWHRGPLAAAGLIALSVAAAALLQRNWPTDPAPVAAPVAVAAGVPGAAQLLRARPFTVEPGLELHPRFTPDARWVVYTRVAPEQRAQLRLRAVDGTGDRELVSDEHDNYCGTVSPDGLNLAWLRTRAGVCELAWRAMLGGPVRVLAGCEGSTPSCPDWSAQGDRLVLGGDATRRGLVEVGFPDGVVRELATPPPGMRDLIPRFSPDGGRIVFWRGDGQARRLFALDLATGTERALRDTALLGFGHAFAADGSLLLADDSHGQRALLRFDPRDGSSELLGGSDARFPDIAPDGAVVYEVARYDANLWRVDLSDAQLEPRRLTTSTRFDSHPAWSPDGSLLAFVSNRDGREAIYVMRADGSDERKLPLDPALRWTSPAWSPEGERLLVLRYDDGGAQFCLHTLSGAQTRCHPELGRNRHGGFFLDASTLAAIDADADVPSLWRMPLDGSGPTPMDSVVVDRCMADTHWLACHRPGLPGLWLQDRRDGQTREVAAAVATDAGGWTLHGDAIWLAMRDGSDPARAAGIHRIDLRDGSESFVTPMLPGAIGATLAVAPDASAIVVARIDGLETDLMYAAPPSR